MSEEQCKKNNCFGGAEDSWNSCWLPLSKKDNNQDEILKTEPKVEQIWQDYINRNSTLQHENDPNPGYETIIKPGFTSARVKRETTNDDILNMFKESPFKMEKQICNQQIVWGILEKINKVTAIKDLQDLYVKKLRHLADLEIYKCAFCNEYESIHQENIKCHLLIFHKNTFNSQIFKCNTCNLTKVNQELMQKHVLTHDTLTINVFDDNDSATEDEKLVAKIQNMEKKLLQCDLCSFTTHSLLKLKKHQLSHETAKDSQKRKKYLCYECPFENASKIKLKKHLFQTHNIMTKKINKVLKNWQCSSCEYNTNQKKSFDIHLLSHKDPEEVEYFYCDTCDFKTKHKTYLKQHFLLKHKDPSEVVKKYMCEICSRRFRVRAKLKIHMLTHKTLSELTQVEKCLECDFQTKTKAALYTHMELHRAPKYVCDLCGHQSRRKWNHEMHLLTHKKENDTEVFRCTVCSYKTKFKARFKVHQQKGNHFGTVSRKLRGTGGPQAMDQDFSDNLKFNCFVCNFETTHRKIFNEHSKSHDNFEEVLKKRFLCEVCGFRAHHKTYLHIHSITHKTIDQVQPLKCDKCEFLTKSFHSLASHRQLHKEPKIIYTCQVCGLKNRRKYNHDVHLLTHRSSSEVPMIKCNWCTYQTKFKAYLREHLKKRHNILTARRPGRPQIVEDKLTTN